MYFNPSVQEILNCDDRNVEYSIVFATTVDNRNVKELSSVIIHRIL